MRSISDTHRCLTWRCAGEASVIHRYRNVVHIAAHADVLPGEQEAQRGYRDRRSAACGRAQLSLAQAARVAGIDRIRFQHLLASRSIPVNYDAREFESDRKTIDSMP